MSPSPPTSIAGITLPKLALPRIVRRHRRASAALLAALAVLLIGLSARPAQPAAVGGSGAVVIPDGMVAVPLALADGAVAGLLHAGDHVDVVALPGETSGIAHVVARDVLVLSPGGSSGFLSSDQATLLVATDESSAIAVAGAGVNGFTVIVHPPL